MSNQAGWRCDECRRSGLEKLRVCGWLPHTEARGGAPVWIRHGISLDTCPKSFITAESEVFVEEFRYGGS